MCTGLPKFGRAVILSEGETVCSCTDGDCPKVHACYCTLCNGRPLARCHWEYVRKNGQLVRVKTCYSNRARKRHGMGLYRELKRRAFEAELDRVTRPLRGPEDFVSGLPLGFPPGITTVKEALAAGLPLVHVSPYGPNGKGLRGRALIPDRKGKSEEGMTHAQILRNKFVWGGSEAESPMYAPPPPSLSISLSGLARSGPGGLR